MKDNSNDIQPISNSLSYEYYRNATRKLIKYCIVLCIINSLCIVYGYYLSLNKHAKTYYATTTNGDLIQIKPYKIEIAA